MGRLFHASAVVEDAMYIFGGTIIDNKHRSGEIFRFQMANFPKCTLHDDFGRLLSTGQLADVRFLVGRGQDQEAILAHVALVAARSEYLRNRIREARDRTANHGVSHLNLANLFIEIDNNSINN